jgi:hypothetical protein
MKPRVAQLSADTADRWRVRATRCVVDHLSGNRAVARFAIRVENLAAPV